MTGEPFARRRLFDLEFIDAPSVEPIARALLTAADESVTASENDSVAVLVTPNVDQLVHVERNSDPTASRTVLRARYVLPDGQPVVWASRLLGRPLSSRLAGSSLVSEMWPHLVAGVDDVLVVAGSAAIAERIEAEGPHIHAIVAPQLSLDDPAAFASFVDQCAEIVRREGCRHVFVGLGFPKRENVVAGLVEADDLPVPAPIVYAIGAAFEMHYGLVRRAPEWMQRSGLEWFFRFVQEPRRLFRRYFVDDPVFVRLVWREWRDQRRS